MPIQIPTKIQERLIKAAAAGNISAQTIVKNAVKEGIIQPTPEVIAATTTTPVSTGGSDNATYLPGQQFASTTPTTVQEKIQASLVRGAESGSESAKTILKNAMTEGIIKPTPQIIEATRTTVMPPPQTITVSGERKVISLIQSMQISQRTGISPFTLRQTVIQRLERKTNWKRVMVESQQYARHQRLHQQVMRNTDTGQSSILILRYLVGCNQAKTY